MKTEVTIKRRYAKLLSDLILRFLAENQTAKEFNLVLEDTNVEVSSVEE
jgi:hypothetical protein